MPVGLILSGVFAEVIGVHNWFLISGLLIMAISLVLMSLPAVRTLDQKPTKEPEAIDAAESME